jgi:poly(3-hydroxybutyrate) depolymerase
MSKEVTIQTRIIGWLAVVAAAIVLLSGSIFPAAAANREGASSGQRQTMMHDGIERSYVVRVPRNLAQHKGQVPLVLVLHGGGNAFNAESTTGFAE